MSQSIQIHKNTGVENLSGASNDQALIDLWLRSKRSPNTKDAYQRDILRFMDFCDTLPEIPEEDLPARPGGLREIRSSHVQLFLEHIESDGAAPSTVARRLSALKSLLTYAQKTGYLLFNVGAVITAPPLDQRIADRILTEEQVQALFKNSAGRDRALLKFLYYSGARISEAVQLRPKDLSRQGDHSLVHIFGKGSKLRIVPIPEHLVETLEPFMGREWIFQGHKGRPIKRNTAYKLVKRAARIAGCPHASPHCMRHSHASHAVRKGAPIHVVQQTLGHANVSTTSVYLHLEKGESSGMYL